MSSCEYTATDTSQAFVPSTFATYKELTFRTFPLEAALFTTVVASVELNATVAVLPVIVVTLTMFGAAMVSPLFYPNTIAAAIALPIDIPDSPASVRINGLKSL
jgi:hypothetical protein